MTDLKISSAPGYAALISALQAQDEFFRLAQSDAENDEWLLIGETEIDGDFVAQIGTSSSWIRILNKWGTIEVVIGWHTADIKRVLDQVLQMQGLLIDDLA